MKNQNNRNHTVLTYNSLCMIIMDTCRIKTFYSANKSKTFALNLYNQMNKLIASIVNKVYIKAKYKNDLCFSDFITLAYKFSEILPNIPKAKQIRYSNKMIALFK